MYDIKTRQIIMDAASAAIEVCCRETSYGQWYVRWEDIQQYIAYDDYKAYYNDIIEELWEREEVLDVYSTNDEEIDLNCGGNWCWALEECEANEDIIDEIVEENHLKSYLDYVPPKVKWYKATEDGREEIKEGK